MTQGSDNDSGSDEADKEGGKGSPLVQSPIPIVGFGGSAGSLEALQTFFQNVPAITGMAYVVVVHLAPDHESMMQEILQRCTSIPVLQVTEPVKIRPDQVYVISPGKELSLVDGWINPTKIARLKGRHATIDLFFRTLAESAKQEAIAIVLSGCDGDGALGLKRIKECGGLTIAQDPTEADYDGMPLSAIATRMVDWILPVSEMASKILQYRDNGKRIQLSEKLAEEPPPPEIKPAERDEAALCDVLAFLKAKSGHDFQSYKRATVLRRIARRMQVNGSETLEDYLGHLRIHPGESGALLQDLLISVTNFFRDRDAFIALEADMVSLFFNKKDTDALRVWVPGCATGEEAYSIAMLLAEHAAKLERPPQIQVFATDLDQLAIEVAREGFYPETISGDVSPERLQQFFSPEQGGYRARRSLRELILFARHDLIKDSPFSRLDLISCRNLLIYLNREAQAKVFDTFHFALRPEGRLLLGSSESAEEASQLFAPLDKKHRLYSRRVFDRVGLTVPAGAPMPLFASEIWRKPGPPSVPREPTMFPGLTPGMPAKAEPAARTTWSELHLKLVERLAPPSLVVSKDHEIMHLSKSAGRFLHFASGEPTMNLLRVVHPRLRTELRTALFRASASNSVVEITGIPLELAGVPRLIDVSVAALEEMDRDFMLVMFREREMASPADAAEAISVTSDAHDRDVVQHLEDELDQMRVGWREMVEQYEGSLEELKASNEELQAMNEELRSASEELDTGREELQSINEEVVTINQELKSKVEELSHANSDLQNFMAATRIGTIFIDCQLRIKRFTPSATDFFNLTPMDSGRLLSDITHRLEYPGIINDACRVLDGLPLVEREVLDTSGKYFLARMYPYTATEGQINGVIITCVDISERKAEEGKRRWLSSIVESVDDAILSAGPDAKILSWNHGAELMFGYSTEEAIGQPISMLTPPDRLDEQPQVLSKVMSGEKIEAFETVRLTKDGRLIDVFISVSGILNDVGVIVGATAIVQDISVRKRAVEELKQARDGLESKVQARTAELRKRVDQLARLTSEVTLAEQRERKRLSHILHDQLQQLLVAAKLRIESLEDADEEKRKVEFQRLVDHIDEALAKSRSLAVELSPPILNEGLGQAVDWLCATWAKENYGLIVERQIDKSIDSPHEDMRILIFLAVKELLFNVVKHSGIHAARLELRLNDPHSLRITLRDHGKGFDPGTMNKEHGSGLGLSSLRERLEMLGGSLEISSKPNDGVMAEIIAPLKKSARKSGKPA